MGAARDAERVARNDLYLSHSLRWLRLRFRRLTMILEGVPQPVEFQRELVSAAASRNAAVRSTPPPALVALARRLGLSSFERDTVLLAAAADLDPTFTLLVARVQGSGSSAATPALALHLLNRSSFRSFAPQGPLRGQGLIEISSRPALPFTSSPMRAGPGIEALLKGG